MSESEFVTFGCRLNTYEIGSDARPCGEGRAEGCHCLQHLRGDGGSHAPGAAGHPQGHKDESPEAKIIVTGCAAQTDA